MLPVLILSSQFENLGHKFSYTWLFFLTGLWTFLGFPHPKKQLFFQLRIVALKMLDILLIFRGLFLELPILIPQSDHIPTNLLIINKKFLVFLFHFFKLPFQSSDSTMVIPFFLCFLIAGIFSTGHQLPQTFLQLRCQF